MRVLHLDAGKEMRGGQWQVLRLMEGLGTLGVETSLLARANAPLYCEMHSRGWRVEPWSVAKALMMAPQFDILHAHDARSHTLGALIPGVRLVAARRVAFPPRSLWKYRRAARVVAVSEFVKKGLVSAGVEEGKISVVYDGVPLLPIATGTAVLAPANAADPAKGAGLALEAARRAGMELRFTTELEKDLAHARLFLYLTHSEGLGSAVLLAMAAGVPVIASKVGGLIEIIRHGENGLLVENSPHAIAAAIRSLLADPEMARQMGLAGRKTVDQRFTAAEMVRRTMEVYRQVLS